MDRHVQQCLMQNARMRAEFGSMGNGSNKGEYSFDNEKSTKSFKIMCFLNSADRGTRTLTKSPSADFESAASAIPPHPRFCFVPFGEINDTIEQ